MVDEMGKLKADDVENGKKLETIVNAGHNQILGTDRFDNSEKHRSPEYAEYRRKWKELPEKREVGEFPLHIDIESTPVCNLRCTMCMFWGEGSESNLVKLNTKFGYMEWGLFKKIIDESAEHKLPSIKLNYRGEPLLHPKLPEMIEYAKDAGILDVQINTNGLTLTENLSKRIIEAGLDGIYFSMDGAIKETYEKIRRGSNFETVVKNIKKFVEIRDSMGLKIPTIRVQMVKMKENAHEVEMLINMWRNVVNRIGISTHRETSSEKYANINLQHFPCHQIWQRLMICWDGETRMCCGDWAGEMSVGDVSKQTIYDIWHGELLNKVRKLHSEYRFNEIPVCAKCEINTPRRDHDIEELVKKYNSETAITKC